MNTAMNNMPVAVSSNPVTAAMIAEKLGLSKNTVHNCMCAADCARYPKKTVDLVRKTAEEMGYDPKEARAAGIRNYYAKTAADRKAKKEAAYLLTHNFPSKEAETKRMIYLREQGYSNADIGRAVGRDYKTVLVRIGKQPEDMSVANRIQGQKNRAARNNQRRQYVADHTVRTYNGLVTELAEVKTKIAKLETDVQRIKPDAIQAAKISTIKMIEDLTSVPATSLQ